MALCINNNNNNLKSYYHYQHEYTGITIHIKVIEILTLLESHLHVVGLNVPP